MNSLKNFNNTSFNKFKFNIKNHLNKTNNCAKGNLKKKIMISENMAVFQCESSNFNSLAHFIFVLCRKGKKTKDMQHYTRYFINDFKTVSRNTRYKDFFKTQILKTHHNSFRFVGAISKYYRKQKQKNRFFLILWPDKTLIIRIFVICIMLTC